jgi:hypothetical protein
MTGSDLNAHLLRLKELLLRERECAKTMALAEFEALTVEKSELLQLLGGPMPEDVDEPTRALAREVAEENRRNAYLYWGTLQYIRRTMELFGRGTAPKRYGAGGTVQASSGSGRLLSGRV